MAAHRAAQIFRADARGLNAFVKFRLLPLLEPLRFARDEVGLHRKSVRGRFNVFL